MRHRLLLLAGLALLPLQPTAAQTPDPHRAELPPPDPAVVATFNANLAWLNQQVGNPDVTLRRAALFDLGWLWEHAPDYGTQRQSLDWFRKAQDAGSLDGELRLLTFQAYGWWSVKPDAQTRPRLQTLAYQGMRFANMVLGTCYSKDACGQPRDMQKAFDAFAAASRQGVPWGTIMMGITIKDGLQGHEKAEAERFYRQGIAEGSVRGYELIGEMYADGAGVAVDLPKARALYEQGAKAGDPDAMFSLGLLMQNGRGGPRDVPGAIEWLGRALAAGQTGAATRLGLIYANGEGVAKDYDKAATFYRLGAAVADASSMNNLGLLYLDGNVAPPLPDSGLYWLQSAVDQGDMFAACNLGVSYRFGTGVPVSYVTAREWFLKGASSQEAACEEELGEMAEAGQASSPQEALQWYTLAAQHGNDKAKDAVQRLSSRPPTPNR